jgi:glycine betaine/choline ABC-type transport system substrate-binding protein
VTSIFGRCRSSARAGLWPLPPRALGVALALMLSLGQVSCSEPQVTLRVGAKSFAEQKILAEMLSRLLRQRGRTAATVVPCGDTYACHRMLQSGALDLMVEYSGTGLAYLGQAGSPGPSSLVKVRRLFKPLGLSWLGGLGFDNGYRLLVAPERASVSGLRSITDLSRLDDGVRVACPREYLQRPQDGLAGLLKRYGLKLRREPLLIDAPGRRFQALFDGRADVAVGYATDGVIAPLGLKVLDDPLTFFPPYEAAVLVRSEVLRRDPGLHKALKALEGRLPIATMRDLNYEVQVQGREPAQVARRFLTEARLIRTPAKPSVGAVELVLAVHVDDELDPMVTRATRALRKVFPDRPVSVLHASDPVLRVAEGKARAVVLGAERFFIAGGDQAPPLREARAEAVAVLATRMVHLIRRADEASGKDPLAGRVGVSKTGSGSALVAEALLAMQGHRAADHADAAQLVGQVAARKLDAALVLAEPGDAALARALGRGGLRLHPLSQGGLEVDRPRAWLGPEQAVQLPYLRPARIPAETYFGQGEPLETLAAQVVLAGPARNSHATAAGGGPAAALPSGSRPLSDAEARALTAATRSAEVPDPVLPSAWALGQQTAAGQAAESGSPMDTILNVLAVAFLVWLATLVVRRRATGA